MKTKKIICNLTLLLLLVSCSAKKPTMEININEFAREDLFDVNLKEEKKYEYEQELNIIDDNYRNYYEIFVGSFQDSNGDGMGDLQGIIQKLDYLQELGITGLWLMPINPSPSYHKYDITDYYDIDKAYGSLDDFKELLSEAKKRSINIIMDLVINHSSNSHPWFTAAVNALSKNDLTNKYISYYNFEKNPTKDKYYNYGMPTGWYYEGWFSSNMPDLNMDSEELLKEIQNIVKFWLEMGVSGFRIDAAMHIYRANNDKNNAFFKWFMDYAKTINENVYVVAEVWSDTNTVLEYYKSSMNSVFNYPFAGAGGYIGRTILSQEFTGNEYIEKLTEYKAKIKANNPEGIDAMFLSNHDNPRSANGFRQNIYTIKFAAATYLLTPGTPFIYYGEEIGMISSGSLDEDYRGPMYWDSDLTKLCKGPALMHEQEFFFPALSKQIKQNNSIYATYKRALRIRNENPEIARGTMTYIENKTDELGIYKITHEDSSVYIIQNFGYKPVSISKNDLGFTYDEVRGYLVATGENIVISKDKIVFPAFSTLILK